MHASGALLGALLAATVTLSGCLGGDDAPNVLTLGASGGSLSDGWAYDGQGIEAVGASIEGRAVNDENAGAFNVTFDYAGSTWSITFDDFAGPEDFKDGGIAFDLVEHGDTGVADTSLPQILARIAAWGTASVLRDGEAVIDPGTGQQTRYGAHLMVSDTTVRGADGRILKSDGSTPYDPATPADATRVENDPQIIFWVKAPSGAEAPRAPVNGSEVFDFAGPETTVQSMVPTERYTSAVVNVTARAGTVPVTIGELTIRVLDAEGNELDTEEAVVAPPDPYRTSFTLNGLTGPATVELTGQGVFQAEVSSLVTYDDHPFLVFTWNDYTLTEP